MRQISRRDALKIGAGALSAAALAACGSSTPSGSASSRRGYPKGKVSVTMFVFLGGNLGVMPAAFAKDYMSRHRNVTVNIYANSNNVGYPKMLAAKQTNPNQPLVNLGFFNGQTAAQGDLDGMWNKLDYSALSNAKDIPPIFRRSNHHGIGIASDQLGLVYNTQEVTKAPTSWADTWGASTKGKLTFFQYYWEIVYIAAKMNGGSLTNMGPGWNFWQNHAHWIRTIVSSNPQYIQVLTNGTANFTSYFNGTALQWKQQGAPVTYVPPKEGAISVPVYLCSVQGNTPDQEAVAVDMINEMISPKWCLQYATTTVAVPANQAVKLPSNLSSLPAFQKSTVDKLIALDWKTVAKNINDWDQRWNQDIAAKI